MFVGYQAAGTRGRALQDGARTVRLHGRDVVVRARVETLHGLSAHADRGEILDWLAAADELPRRAYVVHGESEASAALAARIEEQVKVKAEVPEYLERVEI